MKRIFSKWLIPIMIGTIGLQIVCPTITSFFLPTIYALDNRESIGNQGELGRSLIPEVQSSDLGGYVQLAETSKTGYVGETVIVSFILSDSVQSVEMILPEEAMIVKEVLPADVEVEKAHDTNKWMIKSEVAGIRIALPLRFEDKGNYEVQIGTERIKIEIIKEEKAVSATDENEAVTEENIVEDEEIDVSQVANAEETMPETDRIEDSQKDETNTSETTLRDPITPLDEINHRDVSNWQEFMLALVDPTINYINVINDFESTDNPTAGLTGVQGNSATSNPNGGAVYIWINASQISRKLVIEGNDHQIDFRAVAVGYVNSTFNANTPWDITFQNIDIVHGNYYGAMNFTNLSGTFQSQSRMRYHNLTNAGNQLIHSLSTPVILSGHVTSHQVVTYTSRSGRVQNINNIFQANMEVNQLEILDGSTVELSTISSGNIMLYYNTGKMTIGDDVKMEVTASGTGGEANGANIMIANGNLTIGKRSEIILNPRFNSPAITLTGSGSQVDLLEESEVIINASGRTNNANNSSSNIIFMAAQSSLNVGKKSKLEISASDQGNSTASVIHVAGAATFTVDKEGILDIKSDSTASTHSLMTFTSAASTFSFADARKINLERTRSILGLLPTNGLISISGSTGLLDVDIQSVKQWQHGNLSEEPDFSWTPIFNLKINYAGTLPTINNVSSISQNIEDSFRTNFTTRAQRVLFEYIPDVEVSMETLSEDPSLENSKIIRGKATPHSVIRFDGDPAIPEPTIDSANYAEEEKYHIQADENGDYAFQLPFGSYFTKNNIVKAYAFLNGKSDLAETIVEGIKDLDPLDPIDSVTPITPENPPNIPEKQGFVSIDFVSQFDFGKNGIAVDEETYYAQPQRLLSADDTENQEERPNFIQISDRRSTTQRNGWQLTVTQNDQFKNKEGKELNGASVYFRNQSLMTAQGGIAPSLQQTEPHELIPGVKRVLLWAQNNEGTGTWIYRFGDERTASESIGLTVPKGSNPEAIQYSTTFTWELSAVPGN